VPLLLEHEGEQPSPWGASESSAAQIGCTVETLRLLTHFSVRVPALRTRLLRYHARALATVRGGVRRRRRNARAPVPEIDQS